MGCGRSTAGADRAARPHLPLLDVIASLVDKSLLRRLDGDGDEARFGMLATIREYGLERLAAAGEDAAARRAHAAYFLGLAEQAWPAFRQRAGQEPWLDRLEAERANLRAALAWLDESGDAASLLRLAGALSWFWYIRGPLDEGRSWLERALAAQDADVPGSPRTRAMVGAGLLAHFQGDDEQARTWLEASLAGSAELDDPWLLAFTLLLLGMVAEDHGDYHLAEARFAEALARFRAADDQSNAALTLTHLGVAAWGQGDVERAASVVSRRRGAATRNQGRLGPLHFAWLPWPACRRVRATTGTRRPSTGKASNCDGTPRCGKTSPPPSPTWPRSPRRSSGQSRPPGSSGLPRPCARRPGDGPSALPGASRLRAGGGPSADGAGGRAPMPRPRRRVGRFPASRR